VESITVKADRHSWILDEQSVRPGGCSLVYRALRPDDPQQTPAALKTASPGNEASLLRERELLKALSARGGELPVVPFLDQGTWGARPFLVMPWFDENLETWVEDRRLPERLDVLAKAADAVDALHRTRHGDRTLVHSDLKPSNFLIEARGGGLRVLLADLGACRHLDPWASAGPAIQAPGPSRVGPLRPGRHDLRGARGRAARVHTRLA
jgi:serine/threonine protein kinase